MKISTIGGAALALAAFALPTSPAWTAEMTGPIAAPALPGDPSHNAQGDASRTQGRLYPALRRRGHDQRRRAISYRRTLIRTVGRRNGFRPVQVGKAQS